jgi:hypothetical protein
VLCLLSSASRSCQIKKLYSLVSVAPVAVVVLEIPKSADSFGPLGFFLLLFSADPFQFTRRINGSQFVSID